MHPLYAFLILILGTVILLYVVQPLPSFLLVLPILIASIGVGWYLNKYIQKEHEETIKKSFDYAVEEENAEHWMHQSFVPKTKILLKQHIRELIIFVGIILILFIFFWSYVVMGIANAILAVSIALILYALFVYYLLHADKWYRYFFKHIPKPYRNVKNNDWIHGYVILFPFTLFCYVIYILFNYDANITRLLLSLPVFIFVYSLAFLCCYSGLFLYKEYKKRKTEK